ncbi:HNH endonuclease [Metabacillus sp. RGM 3146]|uniref:HNH endonuclease n=1 Tax=Metabacillus sp. RGM 3146 TaxID=3401092 RepID=UPI003B9CBC9F
MISLHKKEKPNILKEKEEAWTNLLLSYVKEKQKIPPSLSKNYRHPDIKKALLSETHGKCAYCESRITHIDYGDIEHILPKSKNPELTFAWDNFTISCRKCNQSKADYDDKNLPLLNPYKDFPEQEIFFLGPIPFANPKNDRALISLKRLKLDRMELIEKRSEFIEQTLSPLVQLYEKTQNEVVKKEIKQDILALKEPASEFSSMSKQILEKYKLI